MYWESKSFDRLLICICCLGQDCLLVTEGLTLFPRRDCSGSSSLSGSSISRELSIFLRPERGLGVLLGFSCSLKTPSSSLKMLKFGVVIKPSALIQNEILLLSDCIYSKKSKIASKYLSLKTSVDLFPQTGHFHEEFSSPFRFDSKKTSRSKHLKCQQSFPLPRCVPGLKLLRYILQKKLKDI